MDTWPGWGLARDRGHCLSPDRTGGSLSRRHCHLLGEGLEMKVSFWGTRGSLAAPSPGTVRYGGNTSCVLVEGSDKTRLVLDAGTGIQSLGLNLPRGMDRIDILLTHLH